MLTILLYVWMHVPMYSYMYICICIFIYTCVCVHIYVAATALGDDVEADEGRTPVVALEPPTPQREFYDTSNEAEDAADRDS
jgi:hypothetical protein